MLGKSHHRQDDSKSAIAALNKSIELKKENYNARFLLGTIYLGQEKFRQAASEFRAAENADAKRAYKAAYNYAVAMQSDNPDAHDANISNWERFIGLGKKNPKAKSDVAMAEDHVKALKEAKAQSDLQ